MAYLLTAGGRVSLLLYLKRMQGFSPPTLSGYSVNSQGKEATDDTADFQYYPGG